MDAAVSWRQVQVSSALSFARSFIVSGSVFRDGRDSLRGWVQVDGWMVPCEGAIVTGLSCVEFAGMGREGVVFVISLFGTKSIEWDEFRW